MFLQYFDAVGWVFWPVKTVSHITYTVLEGTLNTAQSRNHLTSNFTNSARLLQQKLTIYFYSKFANRV